MADIDKALPNVEQEITLPSDEQIVEEQLEQQPEGPPVEIEQNEDGSVDISYDPKVGSIEGGQNHYDNLADHLPDDVLGKLSSELFQNYHRLQKF